MPPVMVMVRVLCWLDCWWCWRFRWCGCCWWWFWVRVDGWRGCNALGWFLVLVPCWRGCPRRRAWCRGCWCCRRRLRWFRVFPLVRVLWRSVWVLVAVQVWVLQFLVLGFGVVGWVLLGVGARHSWLRSRLRSFASCAGVLGDADGGGALGVTWCRGRGGGCRGVVGDGTLARRWWGWWWCG